MSHTCLMSKCVKYYYRCGFSNIEIISTKLFEHINIANTVGVAHPSPWILKKIHRFAVEYGIFFRRMTNNYSPTSWSVQMLASFRASIDDNHPLILFDGMSAYKRKCSSLSLSVFLFPSLSLVKLSLCISPPLSLFLFQSFSVCIALFLSLGLIKLSFLSVFPSVFFSPPSLSFLCISLILSLSSGCLSNNYLWSGG